MKKNLKRLEIGNAIKAWISIETVVVLIAGIGVVMAMGFLFYDSWLGGVCLMPLVGLLVWRFRSWKIHRRKQQLLLEFKELLYALSGNLKAGYSVENAWIAAEEDLQNIYPENSQILVEMKKVSKQLHLRIPIEQAVRELAERSQLEEIESFAEVLFTAKRSGGNLVHMMDKTATIIAERIEVEQEIQTMLTGKKLEQRIMCGMPVLMLLYLRLTNSVYLDCMYHNGIGILIMTLCLIGTGIAAYWGNHLISIEV